MNGSYERKNRIREALALRNMKQIELSEKTGIAKGTINNWLNQRYQPKQKSLMLLGQALNVNYMWLAGYDVPQEMPERPVKKETTDRQAMLILAAQSNPQINRILNYVSMLNNDQLNLVETMLKELTSHSQQTTKTQ